MNKLIDSFIKYLKLQKNYSSYTCKSYYEDLKEYNNFLSEKHLKYNQINYKNCLDYLSYLHDNKDAKTSISRKLSTLRTFYKYLVKEDILNNNPFLLISSPKKDKKIPKFINYNNLDEIFDIPNLDTDIGQRERVILEILYASGVRISELVNIKLKDIDFNEKSIRILGKGNKERIVYFGEYADEIIKLYIKNSRKNLLSNIPSEYLIVGNKREKLTTRRIEQIIENIIKKSSIKMNITPHMFRHTFATHLLDNGCDLLVVQELLGHESLSSTEIYTHVSNEHLREVFLKCHPRNRA